MHPDGASLRYLAEQVVVSPSRVSRLAEELVVRGWLERALSPHDGRLSLVRLTDAGRITLVTMEATLSEALQAHLLERLTARQLDSLVAVGRALGAPTADGSLASANARSGRTRRLSCPAGRWASARS